MIGVTQEFLTPPSPDVPADKWGDCFRASLASILELPLDLVPNLNDEELWMVPGQWHKRWEDWLWQEFRLRLKFCTPEAHAGTGWYGIGTFRVKGEDWLHSAVVNGNGEVVHDPWPGENSGRGELLEVAILLPVTLEGS